MTDTTSPSRVGTDGWFTALAQLGHIGVLLVDSDGTIQFASPVARRLLRCTDDMPLDDCVRHVREPLARALEALSCEPGPGTGSGWGSDPGDAASVRFVVEDRGGSGEPISCELYPVDVEHCNGFLVLLRDLRAERLAEKELALAARMQNVGRLYQAMAHDLRTPVAAILLYTNLLRSSIDEQPSLSGESRNEMNDHLEIIRDGVQLLDRSLQSLLGELVPTDPPDADFDLRELVLDAVKLVSLIAVRQNVSIELQEPHSRIVLAGYRDRFKQAILNLFMNGLEAMPSGGKLAVSLTRTGDEAELRVADTGCGIPDERKPQVFEKYFTTKATGTGIGLAVVRETVESHRGTISFESDAGKGTVFRVVVPCEGAEARRAR